MPYINTREFFPCDFFKKEVNEKIHRELLCNCLSLSFSKIGDPNLFEPDVFLDNQPFELTLACNEDQTHNFIYALKNGKFTSEKLEEDIISFIYESALRKSKKHYSTENNSISILVTVPLFDWFIDCYGSVTSFLMQGPKNSLFKRLREEFIFKNKFQNIYILMAGFSFDWFCWSVLDGSRFVYKLDDKIIKSQSFPFVVAIPK